MQHCQRKVGWQGQRGKVGNEPRGPVLDVETTCCVTAACIEFPAVQAHTQPCLNVFKCVETTMFPVGLGTLAWSQPQWIIHSYIKHSFPRRVLMFQLELNEVALGMFFRWSPGQTPPPPNQPLPSLTSEIGVKGRLFFHRSTNAYNPPQRVCKHVDLLRLQRVAGVSEDGSENRRKKDVKKLINNLANILILPDGQLENWQDWKQQNLLAS